jgi:hypothetical protein
VRSVVACDVGSSVDVSVMCVCGIGSLRISFPVCGLGRGAIALFPRCCVLTRWGLRMFDVRFDSVLVCVILDRIGCLDRSSLRSNFPVRRLGWEGVLSLFLLDACMLHVGGWLCCDDDDDPSVLVLILLLVSDDVMIYRDRMFFLRDGSLSPMLLPTMSFDHRGCVVYSHSGLYC